MNATYIYIYYVNLRANFSISWLVFATYHFDLQKKIVATICLNILRSICKIVWINFSFTKGLHI